MRFGSLNGLTGMRGQSLVLSIECGDSEPFFPLSRGGGEPRAVGEQKRDLPHKRL